MKIAAQIGVKDEHELIERVIEHLKQIGVDQFVVCDVESTDGTGEILERYRSETFHVVRVANMDPDEVRYGVIERKLAQIDADWIVFLDADEFLLPKSGSLRDVLADPACDIFHVPRFNVPLCANGPMLPEKLTPEAFGDVQMIVKTLPDFYQHLRDNPNTPWIRAVPMPKVIVRRECIGGLAPGMHEITPREGMELRAAVPDSLVTAHVPISTIERFKRRVRNIRECFEPDEDLNYAPLPGQAWHWRRWLLIARSGELESEFERSRFTFEHIQELRRDGFVKSAAEFFAMQAAGDPKGES